MFSSYHVGVKTRNLRLSSVPIIHTEFRLITKTKKFMTSEFMGIKVYTDLQKTLLQNFDLKLLHAVY